MLPDSYPSVLFTCQYSVDPLGSPKAPGYSQLVSMLVCWITMHVSVMRHTSHAYYYYYYEMRYMWQSVSSMYTDTAATLNGMWGIIMWTYMIRLKRIVIFDIQIFVDFKWIFRIFFLKPAVLKWHNSDKHQVCLNQLHCFTSLNRN